MSSLSPRQRVVIAALASLVVVLAAWFLLVSPKRAEAAQLDGDVRAAQERVAVALTQERSSREKQQRLVALPTLVKAMPDSVAMSHIIRELNQLGQQSGLDFQSITPLPLKPAQGFQVLPLTVEFEGDFPRLASFLERLREQVEVRKGKLRADGRLYVVESLQLAEGDKKFPSLKTTLTLDAFVYGAGPAAPVAP